MSLTSRLARVRPDRGDGKLPESATQEWLMIEWPTRADAPDHY